MQARRGTDKGNGTGRGCYCSKAEVLGRDLVVEHAGRISLCATAKGAHGAVHSQEDEVVRDSAPLNPDTNSAQSFSTARCGKSMGCVREEVSA